MRKAPSRTEVLQLCGTHAESAGHLSTSILLGVSLLESIPKYNGTYRPAILTLPLVMTMIFITRERLWQWNDLIHSFRQQTAEK